MKYTKTQSEINNKRKNRNVYQEDIIINNAKVEMVDISNSIKSHSKVLSIKFDKNKSSEINQFRTLAALLQNAGGFHTALSEKSDYYTVEIQFMRNSTLDDSSVFEQFDKLKFNTVLNLNLGLKRIKGEGYNKLYFSLRTASTSIDATAENDTALIQTEDTALQIAAKIKDNMADSLDENIITEQGEKAEKAKGAIARIRDYLDGKIDILDYKAPSNIAELKANVKVENTETIYAKELIELENEAVRARELEEQKELQAKKALKNNKKKGEKQLDIFNIQAEKEKDFTVNDVKITMSENSFIDILNNKDNEINDAFELKNHIDLDYERRFNEYKEKFYDKTLKQVLGEDKVAEMNDRIEQNDFEKALTLSISHGHKLGFLSQNINNLEDILDCKINIVMFVYNNLLMGGNGIYANKLGVEYLNKKNFLKDETENDTDKILFKLQLLEDQFAEERALMFA